MYKVMLEVIIFSKDELFCYGKSNNNLRFNVEYLILY